MQEANGSNDEQRDFSRYLPVAFLVITVLVLVCLLGGLVVIRALPDPPLPTVADEAMPGTAPLPESGSTADVTPPVITEPQSQAPMVAQSGGQSAGDPYIPDIGNSGYDVQRYTLKLALDPSDDTVQGTTVVEATSDLHGLAMLSLDFAGFEVDSVTVDGITAEFSRQDKKLFVTLPVLLSEGAPFTIVVAYGGQPDFEPSPYVGFATHLGLHYSDDDSLFSLAEPDGARYWFPSNDHPRDKATFRFEYVVPEGLTAVANGQLLAAQPAALPDGQPGTLFIWEHNHPMATYLAVVAVGRFERIDGGLAAGVPLRHYLLPGVEEEFAAIAGDVSESLAWMSERFGPYPFETFGYVTTPISGASMETQTMVLLSTGMIGKRTAVHELAHMWFGDWVSLDSWGEMWRNEGFATYLQLMWETRDDPEDLALQMEAIASVVEGNDKRYPLNNPPPEYLFELNVYYQGAMAVHALRQEVGDDAFFTGLRTYLQRYGGGTASDAQFQAVMEEAAGRSLTPFFDEWFPATP